MTAPIILLDEDRVVVADKEAGVTSEALAAQLGLKLVHRIDRATSGLVMLARDARTVQRLQRALREGNVERTYAFVANGVVTDGARESVLVRNRGDGLRGSAPAGTASAPGAKSAAATFEGCVTRGDVTRGTARLVTGRTHQLRIQLAEEGHPIVGERVYVRDARAAGVPLVESPRLLLHAQRLRFVHPNNKRDVEVTSPVPFDG